MSETTELLRRWTDGDQAAFDELVSRFYVELHAVARARRIGDADLTLDTTALVHETYLRLAHAGHIAWADRSHFFAVAARAMRRILVDRARARRAYKRGGDQGSPEPPLVATGVPEDELLALEELLGMFQQEHPRQAQVFEMITFGGFTQVEVADALHQSQPTVARDLRFARAWLAERWDDGPSGARA